MVASRVDALLMQWLRMMGRRGVGSVRCAVVLMAGVLVGTEAWASACPDGAVSQRKTGANHSTEMCVDADGKLHGVATTSNNDGVLLRRDAWRHGVQHGPWETLFPDGTIRSRDTYEEGRKEGVSTIWFASGQKKSSTTYSQGVRHGPVAQWDDSGRQTEAGRFRQGEAHGTWVFYDPGENRLSVRTFAEGEPVTHALGGSASCGSWEASPAPARKQFTAELLVTIAGVSNRPGPLVKGFPFSVPMGQCLVGRAEALQAAIAEACQARPEAQLLAAAVMKIAVDGASECVSEHR